MFTSGGSKDGLDNSRGEQRHMQHNLPSEAKHGSDDGGSDGTEVGETAEEAVLAAAAPQSFTGRVKVWVASSSWLPGGAWKDAFLTVDSSGLCMADLDDDDSKGDGSGSKSLAYELAHTLCSSYTSVASKFQQLQFQQRKQQQHREQEKRGAAGRGGGGTVVQVATLNQGTIYIDACSVPGKAVLLKNINQIITYRKGCKDKSEAEFKAKSKGPPPLPLRSDKTQTPAKASFVEQVTSFLPNAVADFINPKKKPPVVPPKPKFLARRPKRSQAALVVDTSSSLWQRLQRIRDDLPYIPGHLSRLLESIRAGLTLRRVQNKKDLPSF